MSLLDLMTKALGGCALAYRVSPAWSPIFRFSGFPAFHSKFQKGMQDTFQNGLWQFMEYKKAFLERTEFLEPHGLGQTHGFAQGSKPSLVYEDW